MPGESNLQGPDEGLPNFRSLKPESTQKSPQLLHSSSSALGNWELDLQDLSGTFSPEMYELLYLDPAQGAPVFEEFLQRVHPDDRARVEAPLHRAWQSQGPVTLDFRTDPKRGPVRHLRSTVHVLCDAKGHPMRAVGTTLDVSVEQRASESCARLAALVESSTDAIYSTDLEGHITSWNRAAECLLGWSAASILGRSYSSLLPEQGRDQALALHQQLCQGQRPPAYQSERLHCDGQFLPVSVTASPITGAAGQVEGVMEIVRDIRLQLEHERELARLSRLYAALSQINQAIVFTRERQELLNKVCEALVVHGGFELAWVGWHNPDTLRIESTAAAGQIGYLEGLKIYSDLRPEGRGPTGTAFRENRPVICNDLLAHADSSPWWARQQHHAFRASAALPLLENGQPVAVLSVYASEPQAFQDREMALLREAAGDLSFGLEQLLREARRLQAERELREQSDFNQGILDSLPGVLYCYDEQGRFLRWNRRFETVTGYSAQEIAAMHPLDFFLEPDRQRVQERIQEVFQGGESSVEADFVTRSGQAIPYYFTGLRVQLGGQVVLVGVGIDISEREAAQGRYRSLFTHAPDGILIADAESYYLDANPKMCQMLGYRLEELVGKHGQDILAPEDTPRIPEALSEINSMRTHQREWTFRRQDGSTFPAEVISARMPDGYIMAMIRDISERKANERFLFDLYQNLERKVEERTQELREALLRAESADRLKSAFLATMSHELRTPLNSILGFTGIILKGMAGPLTPEQSKQMGMVRSSAQHLLALINDVLDLSKIEANQLEVRCEKFELEEVLQRSLDVVAPLAEKKGLQLTHHFEGAPGTMHSDPRRVEQILLNLLQNAVKFTEQGDIQLKVSSAGPDQVLLEVVDTGIGIRDDDQPSLFQPFRQLDSGLSRQREGTGLGLAICRRLTALLGGEIGVDSEWQRGSRFWVRLPRQSGRQA